MDYKASGAPKTGKNAPKHQEHNAIGSDKKPFGARPKERQRIAGADEGVLLRRRKGNHGPANPGLKVTRALFHEDGGACSRKSPKGATRVKPCRWYRRWASCRSLPVSSCIRVRPCVRASSSSVCVRSAPPAPLPRASGWTNIDLISP